jgi:SAM-dependent methyltransferase
MVNSFFQKKTCRLCDGKDLNHRLHLRATPPANELVKKGEKKQDEFPLDLYQCSSCHHVQLGVVVDPVRLFENYVYVSGTSKVFVKHFEDYADEIVEKFNTDKFVVEIGSNDGTLLKCFKNRDVKNIVGIEPAKKISEVANNAGIFTICDFFTHDVVLKSIGVNSASVVVANNVFAHADDLRSIARGIKSVLVHDGVFVFEVSYLGDVIDLCLFDTIYHEHVSYHSVSSLVKFFDSFGMRLFDVKRVNTHGGSIRCYVDNGVRQVEQIVENFCADEKRFETSETFDILREKIDQLKLELRKTLSELKSQGNKIIGYGAPAKATTLMHEFEISSQEIDVIIDDSSWKQGSLTPGKNVPIVGSEQLEKINPDYVLILAWNFAPSIIEKIRRTNDKIKFIVPVPELQVL